MTGGNKSVTLDILGRNKDAIAKIGEVKGDYEALKAEMDAGNLNLSSKELNNAYRSKLRDAAKDLFTVGESADKASSKIYKLGSGIQSMASHIPLIGGLADALANVGKSLGGMGSGGDGVAGEAETAAKGIGAIAGSGVGLGIVVAAVGAIATEAGALATGLTAVTLGVGAFGALSIPMFEKISTALGATGKGMKSLPEYMRPLAKEIEGIKGQFTGIEKVFAPLAAPIFTAGFGLIAKLMPLLLPLAESVIPALGSSIGMLSKAFGGPTFRTFLKQMEDLGGPVLTAIMSGVLGVLPDVQQLMGVFSKKDVINGVNIAFRILGGTINAVTGLIKFSMGAWDVLTGAIRRAEGIFASVMGVSRHVAKDIEHDWDSVKKHVVGFFDAIPGAISNIFGTIASDAYQGGRHIVSMLISGLESVPVVGAMVQIGTEIFDHLPHSPAKKGPLSGAGSPDLAGRRIGLMISEGLLSSRGNIGMAMSGLFSGAGSMHAASFAGAGGNAPLQIEWVGGSGADQEFITWLKKNIRIRGGSPGVLGR